MTGPAPALGALRFLARNPRRVLPAVVVQALVTALVLAVVTPLTGFGATVEANLRPLTVYTAVTPMSRADFDEGLSALLDANPAQERRVQAKALWMRTPMVVGESFTMLVALRAEEHADFLRRVGNRLVEGVLPAPGSDVIVTSRLAATSRVPGSDRNAASISLATPRSTARSSP